MPEVFKVLSSSDLTFTFSDGTTCHLLGIILPVLARLRADVHAHPTSDRVSIHVTSIWKYWLEFVNVNQLAAELDNQMSKFLKISITERCDLIKKSIALLCDRFKMPLCNALLIVGLKMMLPITESATGSDQPTYMDTTLPPLLKNIPCDVEIEIRVHGLLLASNRFITNSVDTLDSNLARVAPDILLLLLIRRFLPRGQSDTVRYVEFYGTVFKFIARLCKPVDIAISLTVNWMSRYMVMAEAIAAAIREGRITPPDHLEISSVVNCAVDAMSEFSELHTIFGSNSEVPDTVSAFVDIHRLVSALKKEFNERQKEFSFLVKSHRIQDCLMPNLNTNGRASMNPSDSDTYSDIKNSVLGQSLL